MYFSFYGFAVSSGLSQISSGFKIWTRQWILDEQFLYFISILVSSHSLSVSRQSMGYEIHLVTGPEKEFTKKNRHAIPSL